LSRLPGVWRGVGKQYLIAGPCGQESWEKWERFIEEEADDLPDVEKLSAVWDNLPPLAPELITGILREGHKMRLTGPSKAGKSWALIELTCAIAEGRDWMGMACRQGAVMYVNLELDRPSALHRFAQVYKALGWKPEMLSNIDIWNLRGKSLPLDVLAPRLIRRARGRLLKAIIFDPIYKLSWGDGNDAGDVAKFCNRLDQIATELGCAVIDAHHHSKGSQGQKRSIDRGSGSGVFGRDPDACLDLIELDVSQRRQEVLEWCIFEESIKAYAEAKGLDLSKVERPAREKPDAKKQQGAAGQLDVFLMGVQAAFPRHQVEAAGLSAEARLKAAALSGWRLEATLREFATPKPIHVWFDWPTHPKDRFSLLMDAKAEGEAPPWEADREAREEAAQKRHNEKIEVFRQTLEACGGPGKARVSDIAATMAKTGQKGWSVDSVKRLIRIELQDEFEIINGVISENQDDE
jgi:RecA-family ATPase